MVYLNAVKIIKSIESESVTKDKITLNVDGEQLLNEIYEDVKIELDDDPEAHITLRSQNATFIQIYPNELFDEKKCKQLAIEIKNRLNNEIKTKLNLR